MSAWRWFESIVMQLPMRLGLGGIFVFAAWNKLQSPQALAFAIKGFKVFDPATQGHLIISGAYTLPWVEMIAGVLLILGLRSRAAALTLLLTLLVFIAGLVHVITGGIDADCSCFGDQHLFCKSNTVGWCQVIRNLILLIPALYIVIRGGGALALDAKLQPDQSPAKTTSHPDGVDEGSIRA